MSYEEEEEDCEFNALLLHLVVVKACVPKLDLFILLCSAVLHGSLLLVLSIFCSITVVVAVTIDNRIYNTRLNTSHQLRRRKCHQFSPDKNGGHVESRAAIGRRNTPHHTYTRSSCLHT